MKKLHLVAGSIIKKHKRKLTYLFVGTTLFFIDFASTLIVYYIFNLDAGYASATGFCVSFVIGFMLNKRLVFRHSNSSKFKIKTQVSLYLLLAFINLLISAFAVDTSVAAGAPIEVSKVATTIIIACWNYIILGRYIFGHKDRIE